ncbi:MAG TPA: ribonuclease PH [Polyangium sp.]|nr:ribonuclease PH [Polyangium sp.]
MPRFNARQATDPRPVEMIPDFHHNAEGSVLYRAGGTIVLCTASIDPTVPPWMVGRGKGWLTADYQMHPRAGRSKREPREGRGKALSGRTQEIQRLIGRALRSAVDLDSFGERTIVIDCDVLEADGGTRTASVTGSFVATALALSRLHANGELDKPLFRDQVAAISVGHVGDEVLLDLDYSEDSKARVDLNVVATGRGTLIEVQATAEGEAVERRDIDRMIDLGLSGVNKLLGVQRQTLAAAKVDLEKLFQEGRWTVL